MTKIEQLSAVYREVQITASLLSQAMYEANGIPPAQLHILSHLVNTTNTAESPSDLARVFRVSKPAMTQLIQRLRAKGWVSLDLVPGDDRRKQVTLTKSGRSTHKKSQDQVKPHNERIANVMNRSELDQLFTQMHKLRIAAEEELSK